jgi:NRAMP (natural resistance-associated macrophage protein)-like metal ion transporter
MIPRFISKFGIYLGVFGPATIAAIADNDAAGVATYSLAGSQFGYSILFILLLITILLAITQEMGVRIGIVTGKGLGDLIRERYGIRMSMLVFLCLLLANIGTLTANFAALKAVTTLFHIPAVPFVLATIGIAYLFISKGNYKLNQRLFLLGTILYLSYVVSAFKSAPDWGAAIGSLVSPSSIQFSPAFIIAAIAVLGTTITPWGQFFVQSFVIDKKISLEKMKYARVETYFGAFLTNFFSFFMIVATAATLFVNKIPSK